MESNCEKNYVHMFGLRSQTTSWGDGYTLAFCSEHSPEPASSEPRRPHLAVEFVREHMRRRHPGKAGVQDRLFDLPQQADR